jgi:hypothetical protein
MGLTTEQGLIERALLQHFAVLSGIRGASVLSGQNGRWAEVAAFGRSLPERNAAAVKSFAPDAGGVVDALSDGGWFASYGVQVAGLDIVLALNIAPLGPADLKPLLEMVELRAGWLMVAVIHDRSGSDTARALAAEVGADLLLGAARASGRAALADLWVARMEQVFRPTLAATLWVQAGVPRLAVVSGGGPVEGSSDQRRLLEGLARHAVTARAPVLVTIDGDGVGPVEPQLVQLDAASAWVIPVEDGRNVAGVLVLCLKGDAPAPAVADQVAALLAETLMIQVRAHPRPLRRLGNRLLSAFVVLFGSSVWKLKLAVLVLAAGIGISAVTPAVQRPAFTARIEAEDLRIVSAPFDGFLAEAPFQSGDRVSAGDIMVRLDDSDIRLQLTQRRSELAEIEAELQTARAQRDSARVRLLETRRDQGSIAVALLERQVERATHRADRSALVVGGDAWRRVGDRVRLGEPLIEIASPDRFRLRAFVGEDWVSALGADTTGVAVLTAFPESPIPVQLAGIGRDPSMLNGEHVFPVMLEVTVPEGMQVLDGMRGVVRLDLGGGNLLSVYTYGLRRWIDRTLWRWG